MKVVNSEFGLNGIEDKNIKTKKVIIIKSWYSKLKMSVANFQCFLNKDI